MDVLVNVVGGTFRQPFTESVPKGWEALIRTNFTWLLHSTQLAVDRMRPGGGSIINLTSIEAHRAAPGFAVYAAMKAAVTSLTQSLAVELAPEGIRVNTIAPDFIPTERLEALSEEAGGEVAALQRRIATPMGRPGTFADAGGAPSSSRRTSRRSSPAARSTPTGAPSPRRGGSTGPTTATSTTPRRPPSSTCSATELAGTPAPLLLGAGGGSTTAAQPCAVAWRNELSTGTGRQRAGGKPLEQPRCGGHALKGDATSKVARTIPPPPGRPHTGNEPESSSMPITSATRRRSASNAKSAAPVRRATAATMQSTMPRGVTPARRQVR